LEAWSVFAAARRIKFRNLGLFEVRWPVQPDTGSPIPGFRVERREGTGVWGNGIDLASNRLTGSVIHHTDKKHVQTSGRWTPRTVNGMWGLFRFNYLTGNADTPSEANYTLPIPEDGTYQISLLYPSGKDRASNVPVPIVHADGKEELKWNMRKGSRHGFSVEVGKFPFKKGKQATVTLKRPPTDVHCRARQVNQRHAIARQEQAYHASGRGSNIRRTRRTGRCRWVAVDGWDIATKSRRSIPTQAQVTLTHADQAVA